MSLHDASPDALTPRAGDTVSARAATPRVHRPERPGSWDSLHRTAAAVRVDEPVARRRGRHHRSAVLVTGGILAAGALTAGHLAAVPAGGVSAMASNNSALFALTNQDRTSNGVAALQGYSALGAVAENQQYNGCGYPVAGRAQDMINRNYFAHVIPNCGGQLVWSMLNAAGIAYRAAGENIGWNNATDPSASVSMANQMFMASPEHRANILNPNYTHLGIGSAATAPGQTWSGGGSPTTNVTMYSEEFIQARGTVPAAAPPPPAAVPPPFPTGGAALGADGQAWALSPGAGYQPIGGRLVGAPAVTSFGGRTYYVGTGTDHNVWIRSASSDWRPLSASPVICVDNPAADFDSGGTLHVACAGGDRSLWVATAAGSGVPSATGWHSLGGVLSAGPSMASVAGTMTYFAIGADRRLWSTSGGAWVPSSMYCNGHPAAATAAGRTYLACTGLDGGLWATVFAGSWGPVVSLGGRLQNGPAVAASSQGVLFLGEGVDRAVWQMLMSPTGQLGGWQWNGGVVQGGAGASALH